MKIIYKNILRSKIIFKLFIIASSLFKCLTKIFTETFVLNKENAGPKDIDSPPGR